MRKKIGIDELLDGLAILWILHRVGALKRIDEKCLHSQQNPSLDLAKDAETLSSKNTTSSASNADNKKRKRKEKLER